MRTQTIANSMNFAVLSMKRGVPTLALVGGNSQWTHNIKDCHHHETSGVGCQKPHGAISPLPPFAKQKAAKDGAPSAVGHRKAGRTINSRF